jgi:F0F1-type ATP synthase delta subunit
MLQITIASAVALSDAQKKKLEAGLQQKHAHEELVFTYQLQPELIAGISVSVAGKLYDASLRSRLQQLAAKM